MTSAQPRSHTIENPYAVLPSSDKTLHQALAAHQDKLRLLEASLGLKLWRAKLKDDRLVLYVDTGKREHPTCGMLKHWARESLNQPHLAVKIKESPKSECCKKACKGCIRGNPAIKACWK